MDNMLYRILSAHDVLYTSSTEVRICCTQCGDRKYHMYINPEKMVAHCFKCGWGGTVFAALGMPQLATDKRPHGASMQQYAAAVNRLRHVSALAPTAPVSLPAGYVPFTDATPADVLGRLALAYARKRVADHAFILAHAFGYGTTGATLGRLIVPIPPNYWQARTIFGSECKYINPPGYKGGALFNAAALVLNHVAIAEGVFSAIAIGSHAVAILGKRATAEQLQRLRDAPAREYTLHLDADARDFAWQLGKMLHGAGKVVHIQEYVSGDPACGVLGRHVLVNSNTLLRERLAALPMKVRRPLATLQQRS